MMFISSISYTASSFSEDKGFFKISGPDYSGHFEKNEIRRLSPIIITAVGCGLETNTNTNRELCGIITGTGRGCLSKTEQFLRDITTYKETALNPTHFIQSTNNTIGGMIALKLNVNTYNMTYVNQGLTVLNVLTDTEILVKENPGKNVLFGFFEENTEFNEKIHRDSGFLFEKDDNKIFYGEGTSFFLISDQKDNAIAMISEYTLFVNSEKKISDDIHTYLTNIPWDSNSAIYAGYNNEFEKHHFYKDISSFATGRKIPEITFKHQTGDFDTASGHAMAMAVDDITKGKYNRIVIFNHYKKKSLHSIIISKP
ncbi:MAG: 3-oxoacyl-ACP synthase [Candidatus Parvibacillus calidus]|nr:MAG: 3-oxoacyl-ACP synthase [Candidatus Parvibacillus calidus]